MRACATTHAIFAGLALSVLGFAACSGSEPAKQPSSENEAPKGTGPDMPDPNAPTPANSKKEPQTAAECKDVVGNTTESSKGVVMNNAMTAADAGASDRLAPLIEVVKVKRDAFRCCFDIWSRKNAGAEGKVVMTWSLKPDGSLEKVEIDRAKSTLNAPDIDGCMINIASSLTYPASPSKKNTTFTYPFDFKARK